MKFSLCICILALFALLSFSLIAAAPTPITIPSVNALTKSDGPIARAIVGLNDLLTRQPEILKKKGQGCGDPYNPCSGASALSSSKAMAGFLGALVVAGVLL